MIILSVYKKGNIISENPIALASPLRMEIMLTNDDRITKLKGLSKHTL